MSGRELKRSGRRYRGIQGERERERREGGVGDTGRNG